MATKKGIARSATNIKSMTGVPSGVIASLPIGGWVIGDLSPSGTDLINITEWYRLTGEVTPLAVPCKASIANLTVVDYVDTDTEPDLPPAGGDVHVEIDIIEGVVQSVIVNDKVFKQQ